MWVNSDAIIESFEIGSSNDIEKHFFNTDNHTYRLLDNHRVVRVNRDYFFKVYGIKFNMLMKMLREDNFIPLDDTGDYGFYYENDHDQLISDRVWMSKFKVVSI